MKRYLNILLLVLPMTGLKAQSYKVLTDSALHVMWKAKDTSAERQALNLYEEAFRLYPKAVENVGRYKASVLAGDLFELDKAFYYLAPVAREGTPQVPGWKFIAGDYFTTEYKNLLTDQRWKVLSVRANAEKARFFDLLAENQRDFETKGLSRLTFKKDESGKSVYQKIKNFNIFSPKKYRNYSVRFSITDSIHTAYFVHLPENYDPRKRYSLLFFLHGAVQGNALADYLEEKVLEGWNRYYTKYANLNQVILVFPQGSRKYNWMGPDEGFFMVPAILKQIKQSINIDDDKVFITGHSNGATGSFSYLMKEQSPFAGFYGFNTQPKVRTGGTFIKNILNRSFFNVSTDEDYYYPPDANDTLNVIMKKLDADYQDHRYQGYPHWFPAFEASEPAHQLLFADLAARKRNPFQHELYWECDDLKYGQADWLKISQLDTAGKKASWHERLNFKLYNLLVTDKNDSLIKKDTVLNAFNFPRKSAVVKGYFRNNEFHLETSAVKKLSILISPEMVDMQKPVVIYVNGIKKAGKMPAYDQSFILRNFKENNDRKAIWVDQIEISI